MHPAIFAAVYRLASFVSQALRLSPSYHADLMIAAPKILQAVFAALGDYYTWKLGENMYGRGSNEAWAAVCSLRSDESMTPTGSHVTEADSVSCGCCSLP